MYERTTQMPEPPPTGTVSKSLEAAESAITAHVRVKRDAAVEIENFQSAF